MNDFEPTYRECADCRVDNCKDCPFGLFYEDEDQEEVG